MEKIIALVERFGLSTPGMIGNLFQGGEDGAVGSFSQLEK